MKNTRNKFSIAIVSAFLVFSILGFNPAKAATEVPAVHSETTQSAETSATHETVTEGGEHAATEAEHAQDPGILGTLGINWKLFLAQLVNFGLVLFVLWKWVLTPVANKLTERADKIEKSLNDADRVEKEKIEFEKWKSEEMSKARTEANAIVTAAQADANKAKDAAIKQTKEEQEKLIEQAKRIIEQEKNQQLQNAKSELANLVTTAAEKVLKQKLDGKKDQELINDSLKSI